MGQLTIRLDVDPVTKKKNVTIQYATDADALPMEHEEEHRKLVDRLIEGGALKASELGTITIERAGERPVAGAEPVEPRAVPKATPQGR